MTGRAARETSNLVKDHMRKTSREVTLSWGRTVQPRAPASREDLRDAVADSESQYSDDPSDWSDAESADALLEPVGYVQADSRDLITKSLYPRLLYAFSDVVCFVTSNSRYVHNAPIPAQIGHPLTSRFV